MPCIVLRTLLDIMFLQVLQSICAFTLHKSFNNFIYFTNPFYLYKTLF